LVNTTAPMPSFQEPSAEEVPSDSELLADMK
jgi:hypothetical protein